VFLPGQILYFNSFQFKNGDTPKPKYFIVLARVKEAVIVASLPTRTNLVPSFVKTDHGCINIDERCYNSYLFEKHRVVGEKGFAFDMPTFIYGDQVEDYEQALFESNYMEGIDYVILDILVKKEFDAIIHCFRNSNSVRFKIKKMIG
jgi:hypothetical protein